MKKSILVLLAVALFVLRINAQNIDSVKVVKDTIVVKDSTVTKKTKFIPVPKKSLIYSIVPGGGQIYNRKLWFVKLPIVYGGYVGGVIAINYNTGYYRYFKKNYFNKLNNLPLDATRVKSIERISTDVLRQQRDAFYKTMQQSYVFISVWHILSAAEAFTSAHLMNFDVNEDLSLQVKPSFQGLPIGYATGFGIQMRF